MTFNWAFIKQLFCLVLIKANSFEFYLQQLRFITLKQTFLTQHGEIVYIRKARIKFKNGTWNEDLFSITNKMISFTWRRKYNNHSLSDAHFNHSSTYLNKHQHELNYFWERHWSCSSHCYHLNFSVSAEKWNRSRRNTHITYKAYGSE